MVKKFEIHNPETLFEEYDSYELYKPIDAITTGELRKILGAIGISRDDIEEKIYELEQERNKDVVKRPILQDDTERLSKLPDDIQELLETELPQNKAIQSVQPVPKKRLRNPSSKTPILDKGIPKNKYKEKIQQWASQNPLPDS